MLHELLTEVLHPFILYTFAGTIVTFFIVKFLSRWPRFREPRQRVVLLSAALLVPVASYIILKVFLKKSCALLFETSPNWLCSVGNFLVYVLTPLALAVIFLALIKGVASIYGCSRLEKRYGFATAEDQPLLFNHLLTLAAKAGVPVPRIIVTDQKYARCFTYGSRQPVIVISQGILDVLDEEELEAVLAHEMAHIARFDTTSSWIMVFLRDMMFFTPLTYFLFSEYQGEKEMAADDISISLTGKPLPFAQALIKVWRLSPRTVLPQLAFDNFSPFPGFLRNKASVEVRVERLIQPSGEGIYRSLKYSWTAALLLVALSVSILAVVC